MSEFDESGEAAVKAYYSAYTEWVAGRAAFGQAQPALLSMVSVVEMATYDVPWLHLNRFGTNRVALQGTMRAAVGESAAWTWIHR